MAQPGGERPAEGGASSCGQLLRRYRRRAGLTQDELAGRAGYSSDYISKLERGQRVLPAAAADRLAAILGLGDDERAALRAARERRAGGEVGAGRPLAGRERELAELRRHLAGLGPPVLLFAGEPGIGKTRLLEEAVASAAQSGWRLVEGGCQRRGLDPYAPLTGALVATLERLSEAERTRALRQARGLGLLLPEFAAADRPDDWIERGVEPEQRRRVLFSAVGACLRAVAGEAGVLLVLDDLHWAGPDAFDLLAALLAADGSPPIRLIGAYRDMEPSAGGRLEEFVADLARASRVRPLVLEPLSDVEAEQLIIQSLCDAEELQTMLPAIVRRAGGVPFFLLSFVDDLRGGDPATERLTLPWTVRQVIGQRLLALPESAQEPLALAAVAGRAVSPSLLSGVSDRSEDEVLAALEAAAAARLLAADQRGDYRFPHDLIRETIEDGLSEGRRRLLHRRLGEALVRERRVPAETLAYHFSHADDNDKAARYLVLAGDEARERSAHGSAADFYLQALACSDRGGETELAALQEKLADALYYSGRYDDAIAALERASGLHCDRGDEDGLRRVSARLADVHFRRGSHDQIDQRVAAQIAREAAGEKATPASLAARHQFARLLFERGAYKQLLAFGRSLRRIGRTSGNQRLLTVGEQIEGLCLIQLGRLAEGTAVLEPAFSRNLAADDRQHALETAVILAGARLSMGAVEESLALSQQMLPLAEAHNDPVVTAAHGVLMGGALHISGEWDAAQPWFERADVLFDSVDSSSIAARVAFVRGQALIWEGRLDLAERYVGAAYEAAVRMRLKPSERRLRTLLAELDIHRGRPQAALDRLTPIARATDLNDAAINIRYTLARAYLELDEPAQAAPLVEQILDEAERTGAWLYGALALRLRGIVASRQGDTNRAEPSYEEALRRVRAMPFPYGEASILHSYAALERQHGNRQAAAKHLQDALKIATGLGATSEAEQLRAELSRGLPPAPGRQAALQP